MTVAPCRGIGVTINGLSLLSNTPHLLASPDIKFHSIIDHWNWNDPTDGTTGLRLKGAGITAADYFLNGSNDPGTPHAVAASEHASGGTQLRVIDNVRSAGLAGHLVILNLFAGRYAPQYLVGAPVGSADFPAGLAGLAGGVAVGVSDHSGSGNVQYYNAPHYSGSAWATHLYWFSAWLNAMASELASQFVSGSSGPTLFDVIAAVRVCGLNRTTDETRIPMEWPHLDLAGGSGTPNGLGSPDCTHRGVLICPKQLADDGYTPAAAISAHADLAAATAAAFPGKILQYAGIPPTTNAAGFPPITSTSKWPTMMIDPANTASTKTNATYYGFVFPSGISFSDLPTSGKFYAPFSDLGAHHTGLELISYTGKDLVNSRVTGCTGGSGLHTLLSRPALANVASKSTAGAGYPTNTLQLNVTANGYTLAGWRDGGLVYIDGVTSSDGLDTLLNGKLFTARLTVGSSHVGTVAETLPAANVAAGGTANAITLTDQAGNIVTTPSTMTGTARCTPCGAPGLTDLATWDAGPPAGILPIPADPTMRTILANFIATYGDRAQILHNNNSGNPDPTDLPVPNDTDTGVPALDQPLQAYIQAVYGASTGGQGDAGTYSTGTAQSLTTAASPSSGTAPTTSVPCAALTGGDTWPQSVPFSGVLDGQDVIFGGSAYPSTATTLTLISPAGGVAFSSGARVTQSPSVYPPAYNARVNGGQDYLEWFRTIGLGNATHQAALLFIVTPGSSTTVLPVPEWVVLVRRGDGTLASGQLLYTTIEIIPRYNAVGSWTVTAPYAGDPQSPAGVLREEGASIVVLIGGNVVFSGPVTKPVTIRDGDLYYVQAGGVSDEQILIDRLAHQDPADAGTAADGTTYTYVAASDDLTDAAESVLKHYVDVNCGPSAVTVRQVPGLTIEADEAQGAPVVATGWVGTTVLDLIAPIAAVGGVGFKVVRTAPGALQFQVYVPVDKSNSVKFSTALGNLAGYQYGSQRPAGNVTYVGGAGTGTARVFEVVEDAVSVGAWGRIERFLDQGSTADAGQLQAAGLADLLTVAAQFFFSATTIETKQHEWAPLAVDPTVTPYDVGDIVGFVVDGQVISEQIRELHVVHSGTGGTVVTPTIGSTSQSGRPEQLFYEAVTAVIRQFGTQLRALQRR